MSQPIPTLEVDYRLDRPAHWHHEELSARREAEPFFWNPTCEGFWMIQRYEHVREALQNPRLFTNDTISP